MTIHLDTSVLIDAFCEPFAELDALEHATAAGHLLRISSPVLFEWLRGPRTDAELRRQNAFFRVDEALVFDAACARLSAAIYRAIGNPRGREWDIAIASCAIEHNASLWTSNVGDFSDIPRLRLYRA